MTPTEDEVVKLVKEAMNMARDALAETYRDDAPVLVMLNFALAAIESCRPKQEPADHIGDADKMVTTETVTYTDGTTATGPMPLPRLSPKQQSDEAAFEAEFGPIREYDDYPDAATFHHHEGTHEGFLAGRQSSRKDAEDAALWIALQWNDHNHDAETMFAHAKRAADGLGLQRGGPDARDELFALWNAALAGLKVGAGWTAPEGHNAEITGRASGPG